MQSLSINTGEIRLAINDDPQRVIVFNPADVLFAERFYKLFSELRRTLTTEYQPRFEAVERVTETDENNVPVNVQSRIDLVKEVCAYFRSEIDKLFGVGTSQIVFGDSMNLDAFTQFFEGITPFIRQAREDKIKKYSRKK